MFTQEEYRSLYPLACDWAAEVESAILSHGLPLAEKQTTAASRAGVQDIRRVRILAVSSMPQPEDEELRAAAARANIIPSACRGMAIGYGVMLRADSWTDQELLAHQLVHVAQHERLGGLEPYLKAFFNERLDTTIFGVGPLELEARELARKFASV